MSKEVKTKFKLGVTYETRDGRTGTVTDINTDRGDTYPIFVEYSDGNVDWVTRGGKVIIGDTRKGDLKAPRKPKVANVLPEDPVVLGTNAVEDDVLQEFVIHVPVTFNTGTRVPPELRDRIEQIMLTAFGGFTNTQAQGTWKDDTGKVYGESMARYIIAGTRNQADTIREIANFVKVVCLQESVYVVINGTPEFI